MTINIEKIKTLGEILLSNSMGVNELFKTTLVFNDITLFKKVFNQEIIKSKVTIALQEAFDLGLDIIRKHQDGTQYDYINALKCLYQHFPDLSQTSDKNGVDLLSEASVFGKNKIVELLLKEYNHDINAQDRDGNTALHKAIMYNQNDIVKILCQSPNIQLNKSSLMGMSPIITSIAYKNVDAENILQNLVNIKNYHFTFKMHEGDKKFSITEFKKMVTSGKIEFSPMPELSSNNDLEYELNYFKQSIFFYFKALFSDTKSIDNIAKNSVACAIKYLKLQAKHSDIETNDKVLHLLNIITNLMGLRILSSEYAIKIFENIKHFNIPLSATLYLNASYYYLQIKSFEEAEKLASISLTQTPSSSLLDAVYYNLYYAQYNQGKISEAEISLKQAQLYNPEDLDIKLGLICIDIIKGRYEEAYGSIELLSSLDINPTIVELYTKLAMHIITAGTNHDLAFAALSQAIELDPENTLLDSYKKLFNIIQSNTLEGSEINEQTSSEALSKNDQDTQTKLDNKEPSLPEKDSYENPESLYETEERADKNSESAAENLSEFEYEIETQNDNIDSLIQIEIATYFPKLDGNTLDLLDPKIIHEFFNRKKKIEIHYRDNEEHEEYWNFNQNNVIKSTQDNVYKVSYFNKNIYVTIDKQLFSSLECVHQEAFTRAINNGFVTQSKGKNGIKIINGKLIELKINQDIRLITKNIWTNDHKSQLIVFEERKSHQEIKKILSETKIIQITSLENKPSAAHKALLCIDDSIFNPDYGKPFEAIADNLLMMFKFPNSEQEDYFIENGPIKQKSDCNSALYNLNLIFKSGDILIDTAKLAYQPTFEHSKKLVVDINLFAASYYGGNMYSIAIALSSIIEGDYNQALINSGYMALPAAAEFIGIPSAIYIAAITTYSAYSLANNAISLLKDINTKEGQVKSTQAYNNLYKFISDKSIEVADYVEQLFNTKLPYLGETIEIEADLT